MILIHTHKQQNIQTCKESVSKRTLPDWLGCWWQPRSAENNELYQTGWGAGGNRGLQRKMEYNVYKDSLDFNY